MGIAPFRIARRPVVLQMEKVNLIPTLPLCYPPASGARASTHTAFFHNVAYMLPETVFGIPNAPVDSIVVFLVRRIMYMISDV